VINLAKPKVRDISELIDVYYKKPEGQGLGLRLDMLGSIIKIFLYYFLTQQ